MSELSCKKQNIQKVLNSYRLRRVRLDELKKNQEFQQLMEKLKFEHELVIYDDTYIELKSEEKII